MKYLLVLLVVAVGVWLLTRGRGAPPPGAAPRRPGRRPAVPEMVACAHCGVHLPGTEAVNDAAGRAFCSDAHRLAGPR